MDIIETLAGCDLGREIYHSDGEGHVQVELVSDYGFETPAFLLDQVEQQGLWPEFFEMAKAKGDEWILRITSLFSDTAHYSTICFVEFLSLLSDRGSQIMLLQDAPQWLWNKENDALIRTVIDKASQLADSAPRESPGDEIDLSVHEWDLSILNGVISRLEAKLNKSE